MSAKAWINGIGVSLVLWALIFWAIHAAVAADLAIPRSKPPERCLVTGEQPAPGQTLHVDKRCASGLRWVYQK